MSNFEEISLSSILFKKKYLIEILIVALFMALGINLISSGIERALNLPGQSTFYCGILICIVSLYVLIKQIINVKTINRNIEGFILYDSSKNRLININRYEILEHICDYFEYAFNEKGDLKELWNDKPLSRGWLDSTLDNASYKLIREAIEYYIIDQLSMNLSMYFNRIGKEDIELKVFTRGDIPDILITNRFLELFSRPVNERPKFTSKPSEYVISSVETSKNGKTIHYSKLDLMLPKDTVIKRDGENCLSIETNKFTMSITSKFEGYNAALSKKYLEYAIDEEVDIVVDFQFDVIITINFKLLGLLTGSGWIYHSWVDSFIIDLENKISQNRHFANIGWETALTLLESSSKGKR